MRRGKGEEKGESKIGECEGEEYKYSERERERERKTEGKKAERLVMSGVLEIGR